MSAVKVIVRNGRIDLPAPDEIPDGTEVLVDVTPISLGKIGIDEDQWRDDPASLADWDAWIKTIEPIELTPDEAAAHDQFDTDFRRFNVEAVRKQMSEGVGNEAIPPRYLRRR